jgi:phage FluMu gp28-like protein
MCEPYDSQSIFLQTDLVEDAERGYDPGKVKESDDLFLGVDVGRTHDLTVFWLLASVGGALVTKDIVVLKNRTFSDQEAEFYKLLTLPMLRRACVDQTGIGRQFVERAAERFGKYRVEGITFTNSVKEQLAYLLRATFENRAIRIPGDEHIRADLRAVKRENTFAGNLRFAAERTEQGHGDRFWALALAIHAAEGSSSQRTVHFEHISHNWRVKKSRRLSVARYGVIS